MIRLSESKIVEKSERAKQAIRFLRKASTAAVSNALLGIALRSEDSALEIEKLVKAELTKIDTSRKKQFDKIAQKLNSQNTDEILITLKRLNARRRLSYIVFGYEPIIKALFNNLKSSDPGVVISSIDQLHITSVYYDNKRELIREKVIEVLDHENLNARVWAAKFLKVKVPGHYMSYKAKDMPEELRADAQP